MIWVSLRNSFIVGEAVKIITKFNVSNVIQPGEREIEREGERLP